MRVQYHLWLPAGADGVTIQAAAWDVNSERLALALGGKGSQANTVALFATAAQPMLTARSIGFIRDRPHQSSQQGDDDEAAPSEIDQSAAAESTADQAAGADQRQQEQATEEVALAFQHSFDGGSLLAVRRRDQIRVLPLYYNPA